MNYEIFPIVPIQALHSRKERGPMAPRPGFAKRIDDFGIILAKEMQKELTLPNERGLNNARQRIRS